LTPEVQIFFGDKLLGEQELPDENMNACDWLVGTECPLDAGEEATYLLKMPVPEVTDTFVGIVLRLKNQDEEPLFCFRVDLDVRS
jgi:hypothetical protein